LNLSRKKKTVFIIIAVLLSFLIVELSLRIIERIIFTARIKAMKETIKQAVQYNPYENINIYGNKVTEAKKFSNDLENLRLAYRPYVERRRVPNQHLSTVNINKWGYRGPEFTFEKPKRVFRIILFGGSFVWGTGALRDDETIAGQLEKLLRKNYTGKKFEVINGGETAYVLTQERILFIEESIFFSPDLVIFIDGVNDLWVVYNNLPAGFPAHYEAYNERLSVNYKKPVSRTLQGQINFLRNQLYITWNSFNRLSLVDTVKSFIRNVDDYHVSTQQLAGRHLHNTKILSSICEARGIGCVFAFQPILYLRKPLSMEEAKIVNKSKKYYPGFYEFVTAVYPGYRDILADEMKKEGIHFLDFMNVFVKDSSNRYIDHFHLTGEGYQIIAERLFDFLRKQSFFE